MRFEELVREVAELQAGDLSAWIATGWVRPRRRKGAYHFSATDAARVRLICELQHELSLGEDAMPVVLCLLDQVYGLRRELRALAQAVAEQPPKVRRAIVRGKAAARR